MQQLLPEQLKKLETDVLPDEEKTSADPDLLTAQSWNNALLDKYGYGLWDFVYALIGILQYRGYKYFYPPGTHFPPSLNIDRAYWRQSFSLNKKKRENLKKRIIKDRSECLIDVGFMDSKAPKEIKEKIVRELYADEFKKLDSEIRWSEKIKTDLSRVRPLEGKGAPVKLIHQIAFLFSEVMKDKRGRRQWSVITELLHWLYEKLKTSEYARIYLNPHGLKKERLKKERLKKEFRIVFKRSGKPERYKYLEKERSYYFPIEKNNRRFPIKFTDKYIKLNTLKNRPIIIFPNGERFEGKIPKVDHHPAPTMPQIKQNAISIRLTAEDKKRYQKFIRMRQEGGISLKGIPAIN